MLSSLARPAWGGYTSFYSSQTSLTHSEVPMRTLLRPPVLAGVLATALSLSFTFPLSAQLSQSGRPSPEAYQSLEWRNIGPEGNRFSAAAGIPGDPFTYYVGAASGGIPGDTTATVARPIRARS